VVGVRIGMVAVIMAVLVIMGMIMRVIVFAANALDMMMVAFLH
jgi:hypothetical protein